MESDLDADGADAPPPKKALLRVALLVALIVGLYVIGKVSGLLDGVDATTIRDTVRRCGTLGAVAYIALFAVGSLAHVPGLLFVAAGVAVYGRLLGFFLALAGAILAVCTTFVFVRAVGGKALAAIKQPLIRRLLARLDAFPVRTLIVLRAVFFISPPLNYALALSKLRFRDYALGSALGLVVPMAVVTLFLDWLLGISWLFG